MALHHYRRQLTKQGDSHSCYHVLVLDVAPTSAFRDTQSIIQSTVDSPIIAFEQVSLYVQKHLIQSVAVCGSAWQSVISAVQHASLMPLLLSFLGGDLGGKCYSCLYSYHDPHQVCHDNWYGDCFFPVMILIRSLC